MWSKMTVTLNVDFSIVKNDSITLSYFFNLKCYYVAECSGAEVECGDCKITVSMY